MGKRYYTDFTQSNTSIYANLNQYGYRLNINHASIKPYYDRYKAWKGLNYNQPLSDMQRLEFESYMFDKVIPQAKSIGN